jgi:cytochrome c556
MRSAGLASAVAAGLLVVGTLGAPGCATTAPAAQPPQQKQLTQAVSPPERLRPAEPLSDIARALLRERMASHSRDMGELVSDIMVLRYDQIRAGAQRIAADANFSRPLSADASELNSALPEKFFLYQDDLRLEARTLAEAAGRQHPFDVADSYGRLSQVCVRCHATYRAGR